MLAKEGFFDPSRINPPLTGSAGAPAQISPVGDAKRPPETPNR
jgi:hypothetical protein